jgi:hypothetical protein
VQGDNAAPVASAQTGNPAGSAGSRTAEHPPKGLKGHFGALRRGEITTGLIKVVAVLAGAAVAAALNQPGQARSKSKAEPDKTGGKGHTRLGTFVGWATDTALVAGLANLINLLDLRPGRALKAAALVAATTIPAKGGPLAAGSLVAMAAAAPSDLHEQTMLGDCGANALGSAAGLAAARSWPRRVKVAAVAGIVGLTLASERHSFSKIIAQKPWLDRLDRLGRRP